MIAVIAILAALLLPALSRAKQKAHAVVCLSNQHQINLSFRLQLEGGSQRLDQQEVADWWFHEPGRQQKGCWICPSAPPASGAPAGSGEYGYGARGTVRSSWRRVDYFPNPAPDPPYEQRAGSYGINEYLFLAALDLAFQNGALPNLDWGDCLVPGSWRDHLFRSESEIARPLATPFLADSIWTGAVPHRETLDLPPTNLADPGCNWSTLSAIITPTRV